MAERAEQAHDQHDEIPPETCPALASLVLTERRCSWPIGDQWTARAADGGVVDVWRLPPMDAAAWLRWAEAAPELVRVRHPNLVPVLATGERDGDTWVVAEPDAGCSLRRLLAVTTLTPEQGALVVVGVLAGLRALHRAGLTHGCLDERTVHVGAAGEVRLGEWSLDLDRPDSDRQAAVALFGRLRRSVRPHAHRSLDGAATLLRTLDACRAGAGEEVALLERAGTAAAAVLEGRRARARAVAGLAALVGRLRRDQPARPAGQPAPVVPLPSSRAAWAPRRRRSGLIGAALAALAVAGAAAAVPLVAPHVHLPRGLPGRPAARASAPATTSLGAPVAPRAPASPRPVPVLAPAAAGPITGIEIQPLAGACQPNAACPVQVTVRLQPQLAAQEVRWSFRVFDRCTGTTAVLPGGTVTALAGWAYVYATGAPALGAGHPLAVIAVTESPAAAASPAVLAGGTGPC